MNDDSRSNIVVAMIVIFSLLAIGIVVFIGLDIQHNANQVTTSDTVKPIKLTAKKVTHVKKSPTTMPWLYLDSHEVSALALAKLSELADQQVGSSDVLDFSSVHADAFTYQDFKYQAGSITDKDGMDVVNLTLTDTSLIFNYPQGVETDEYTLKALYQAFYGSQTYNNAYASMVEAV